MIYVVLGALASGKNTRYKILSEVFRVPYISTGDILRQQIKISAIVEKSP